MSRETKAVFSPGPTVSFRSARRISSYLVKSSVKWNDPGLFLKSQVNFFLLFPCTLFLHIFDN